MNAFFARLRVNWMRNLLAMLQLGLAVAAVTAVLANVLPALRSGSEGAETVYDVRYGMRSDTGTLMTSIFYVDDAQYLLENADSIEAASIVQNDPVAVVRVRDDRYAVSGAMSVGPAYHELAGLNMAAGTFFTEDEMPDTTPSVAVISDSLAKIFFGNENPVGRTINLRPQEERSAIMGFLPSNVNLDLAFIQGQPGTDLTIVGMFTTDDTAGFAVNSPQLLVPAAKNRQALRIPAVPPGAQSPAPMRELPPPTVSPLMYGSIMVKPRPGLERQAEQEVATLLRSLLQERAIVQNRPSAEEYDVMISPSLDMNRALRESRLRQSVITGAIGLAALIVAGFAVFTTTMANLTQRVRAIGLSRSIGATRGYVIREVVVEAALMSGLGGLIGVLVSYPLSQYVLTPLQFTVGTGGAGLIDVLLASLLGVLLAMVTGALAAIFPAWSVANLAPAEAWREGRA